MGEDSVIKEGRASGGQVGRELPKSRKYIAKYDMVSLEEASKRMSGRINGDIAPIENGLDIDYIDDPDVTSEDSDGTIASTDNEFGIASIPEEIDFDAFGDSSGVEVNSDSKEEQDKPYIMANLPLITNKPKIVEKVVEKPVKIPSKADKFLDGRTKIEMVINGMHFKLNAIFVSITDYSITVLLPIGDSGEIIPNPSSEAEITYFGETFHCFFPGSYFKVDDLSLYGLCFIKGE